MSPIDTPESDKITLVTADEPPQRYAVSRSKLIGLSSVFRDLLTMPTTIEDGQSKEIPLTDRMYNLVGLISVFRGEEEHLSKLSEERWPTMARMADKYNCSALSIEVVVHAW